MCTISKKSILTNKQLLNSMKKFFSLFFAITFLSIITTSCGGPDPVKFNDALVDYIDKAHKQGDKIEIALTKASETLNFSQITEDSKAAVDSINSYIQAVEKIEPAKGGETLKTNVIEYLNTLVTMVDSYKSLSVITDKTPEADVNKIFEEITKKEEVAQETFNKIEKEQRDFATKNNMELR